MRIRARSCFLLYSGLAVALCGCTATNKDFAKAKADGTSEAYADFIARYPQSGLREQAEKGKEEAVWRETAAAGKASAYLSFLKSRPAKHPRAAEARERCRGLLVDAQGSEDDYLDYLYRYPDDPRAADIRRALAKVRFDALREARDLDAYALFISQYPGTPEAAKLSSAVQRRDFKAAEKLGTRLACQFFLQRYPSSAEAGKARAWLESLGSPARQEGDAEDLEKLLPRLRRASAVLVRRECRKSLSARIRRQPDLFGADAEELRNQMRFLSNADESVPEVCVEQAMAVPAARRQTAANAVHALAGLMERQRSLASVFSSPDKLAANAQEIGARAAGLADDSETQELELEALYGSMPADPKHPEDTASKNAREAVRRAKRAWDLARGMGHKSKRDAAAEVLRLMDRQADLLIEIIASLELPSAARRFEEPQEEERE